MCIRMDGRVKKVSMALTDAPKSSAIIHRQTQIEQFPSFSAEEYGSIKGSEVHLL